MRWGDVDNKVKLITARKYFGKYWSTPAYYKNTGIPRQTLKVARLVLKIHVF